MPQNSCLLSLSKAVAGAHRIENLLESMQLAKHVLPMQIHAAKNTLSKQLNL